MRSQVRSWLRKDRLVTSGARWLNEYTILESKESSNHFLILSVRILNALIIAIQRIIRTVRNPAKWKSGYDLNDSLKLINLLFIYNYKITLIEVSGSNNHYMKMTHFEVIWGQISTSSKSSLIQLMCCNFLKKLWYYF